MYAVIIPFHIAGTVNTTAPVKLSTEMAFEKLKDIVYKGLFSITVYTNNNVVSIPHSHIKSYFLTNSSKVGKTLNVMGRSIRYYAVLYVGFKYAWFLWMRLAVTKKC